MKVLQINAVYGIGSTGKIAQSISEKLISQGHEAYAMWATRCINHTDAVKCYQIGGLIDHKIHALLSRLDGGQGFHSRLATKKACKQILRIRPDVVHLHNLHSNYIHLPTLFDFLAKNDIPTLITLHDAWFVGGGCMHYINHDCDGWLSDCSHCKAFGGRFHKNIRKYFSERRRLYRSVPHLAVNGVSQWTAEMAKKSILGTASVIESICNWVDTSIFVPRDTSDPVKEKYGIPKDKQLILGVAQSWGKDKGIDAFAALADAFAKSAYIVLVGDGSEIPEKANLKCIGFTSGVDELVDLYSTADVLVNASHAETFGLVTVEAMACGTPVVAFDNTGSSEIVVDGCGMLAEDGNVEALIACVKQVLGRGRASYSTACRAYVSECFEKEKQLQKYIELYGKISKESKDPR